MKAKLYAFNNMDTGDVVYLTKKQGRGLNEDWARIRAVVNEKGERVLRMQLRNAVVDMQEGAPPVVASGEIIDVDTSTN